MDSEKMLELAQKAEAGFRSLKRCRIGRDLISGLKPSEHFTLWMLHTINEGKKVMPSQLAKKMDLSMPAITHQLKALGKHGYVARETSRIDKRRVYVSVSEKGRRLLERLKECRRELMHGFIEYLGEEDTMKLLLLISKAVEYFKSMDKTGQKKQ
ncbi:MAG: MarR family transcriptional regulator [Christensenellales bacterium]|jgi:DNA-binding MarR family transcriptional regulator